MVTTSPCLRSKLVTGGNQFIFNRTICVSKVMVFLRPFEIFRPTIWFALEFRRRKLYVDWNLRHPDPCVEVSCASPCPRWKQPHRIEVPMGYLAEVCTSSACEHDFGFQAAKALVTQRLPDLPEADTWDHQRCIKRLSLQVNASRYLSMAASSAGFGPKIFKTKPP